MPCVPCWLSFLSPPPKNRPQLGLAISRLNEPAHFELTSAGPLESRPASGLRLRAAAPAASSPYSQPRLAPLPQFWPDKRIVTKKTGRANTAVEHDQVCSYAASYATTPPRRHAHAHAHAHAHSIKRARCQHQCQSGQTRPESAPTSPRHLEIEIEEDRSSLGSGCCVSCLSAWHRTPRLSRSHAHQHAVIPKPSSSSGSTCNATTLPPRAATERPPRHHGSGLRPRGSITAASHASDPHGTSASEHRTATDPADEQRATGIHELQVMSETQGMCVRPSLAAQEEEVAGRLFLEESECGLTLVVCRSNATGSVPLARRVRSFNVPVYTVRLSRSPRVHAETAC